ncbi:MAG: hypothetical protein K6U80_08610 [Firmicutes bacterium]|nr:hypothetical protein [Bacillota bacterium]
MTDKDGKLINELKEKMNVKIQFIELYPISEEEKWLLANTLLIISKFGSIGGKTALKPQKNKNDRIGRDFGIVSLTKNITSSSTKEDIKKFLNKSKWRPIIHRMKKKHT